MQGIPGDAENPFTMIIQCIKIAFSSNDTERYPAPTALPKIGPQRSCERLRAAALLASGGGLFQRRGAPPPRKPASGTLGIKGGGLSAGKLICWSHPRLSVESCTLICTQNSALVETVSGLLQVACFRVVVNNLHLFLQTNLTA